jgi:hypothetical protein
MIDKSMKSHLCALNVLSVASSSLRSDAGRMLRADELTRGVVCSGCNVGLLLIPDSYEVGLLHSHLPTWPVPS